MQGFDHADLTVDTVNETVVVRFYDANGEQIHRPADVTIAFASDNEAVATLVPDPGDPYHVSRASIEPAGLGTANVTATVTDGAGAQVALGPAAVTIDHIERPEPPARMSA